MRFLTSLYTVLVVLAASAGAQIRVVNFGSGNSSFDGWVNLNSANFPGYGGSFPGNSSWPGPIGSNASGSADSELIRVSGSPTGGGPFLSSASIYFGNFAQIQNALGGTLRVVDPTPLIDLKTLVFQIQIGEVLGFDFFSPSGGPSLKVNGGASAVNPLFSGVVDRFQNGTFPSPATGNNEPVYVNTWGYQWDVSSFGPVTSFSIDFSAVTHAQVYALQLDQNSSLFSVAVIPEPRAASLMFAGVALWLVRRRFHS